MFNYSKKYINVPGAGDKSPSIVSMAFSVFHSRYNPFTYFLKIYKSTFLFDRSECCIYAYYNTLAPD